MYLIVSWSPQQKIIKCAFGIGSLILFAFHPYLKRKQKQEELSPAFAVKFSTCFLLLPSSGLNMIMFFFSEKCAHNCVTALISSWVTSVFKWLFMSTRLQHLEIRDYCDLFPSHSDTLSLNFCRRNENFKFGHSWRQSFLLNATQRSKKFRVERP